MNEARIKLAEAMGGPVWEAYINPAKHPECVELPDPETDANDDYAVLEWMRSDNCPFGLPIQLNPPQWKYEIGDYARAALKVLKIS